MANEKIYVVTKGTYSDYHIVAATTDRKLAEKIAAKFNEDYDDTRIEEYGDAEVMLRPAWMVYFNKAGNVIKTEECEDEYDYENIGKCREGYSWRCDYDISITVSADYLESAIKIAAEKRAQYLAEKLDL